MTNSICELTLRDTELRTGPFCRTCRYHKEQDRSFHPGDLFPRGFCPHAYRAAYPYALALLYNARFPAEDGGGRAGSVRIRCPGSDGYIEMNLSTEHLYPKLLRTLKDAAIWLLQKLNIPAEYPDKNVFLEVCRVEGNCRYDLKPGNKFKFNLFDRKELCPASFYGLYPILVSRTGNAGGGSSTLAHCPDPLGVFYEIANRSFSCADFLKEIKIPVGGCPDDCPRGLKRGGELLYAEKTCPLAFYAAFPYYWTYIHAGRFDWVRKNERVRVQCPKRDGVVMEIGLSRYDGPGDGAIEAKIIQTGAGCPYGCKKGDVFVLDSRNRRTCYELLVNMISVAGSDIRNGPLSCPGRRSSCGKGDK